MIILNRLKLGGCAGNVTSNTTPMQRSNHVQENPDRPHTLRQYPPIRPRVGDGAPCVSACFTAVAPVRISTDMLALMNMDRALTPDERKKLASFKAKKKGLHAAEPGTGPAGETCGSCANLHRKEMSKVYLKCNLTRPQWTGGGGTDVRARDPACSKWEGKGVG
jgi:hypothetical protein